LQLKGGVLSHLPDSVFRRLAADAHAMGAKIVGIKAGARGLYVRVGPSLEGFGRGMPAASEAWEGYEVWAPCYQVEVAGTTGAGDATIAGFLMGMLRGMPLLDAARAAVAAGACCCERADAVSGVRSWEETSDRIARGWPSLGVQLGRGWRETEGLYLRRTG
jgi:sugar/nucleoside kinase (ribokinase family)